MIKYYVFLYFFISAVRKYIFNSPFLFLIIDFFMIYAVLKSLSFVKLKYPEILQSFSVIILISIVHGSLLGVYHEQIPFYIIAGLREIFYPMAGLIIALSISMGSLTKLYKSAIFALIFLVFLGFMQILSGPESTLNFIPKDQELGSFFGFGGYDARISEIFGIQLFRPSAIFMVTGQFGTVVSGLTIFVIVFLIIKNEIDTTSFLGLRNFLILLFANLISMQRAFFYFSVFSVLLYLVFYKKVLMRGLIFTSSVFLLLSMIYLSFGFFGSNNIVTIMQRIAEFPGEVLDRLSYLSTMKSLFDRDTWLFGDGFGYYSNYAYILGGESYGDSYEGEGGFHITFANIGVLGFFVYHLTVLFFLNYFLKKTSINKNVNSNSYDIKFFILIMLYILITLWQTTHHIQAQSFLMFFVSFSATLLTRAKESFSRNLGD